MAATEFERVVRDAMERENLSLSALARDSGIERRRWYSWFDGDNQPRSRTMLRAAQVLKVDVEELLAPFGQTGMRREPMMDPAIADLVSAIQSLVEEMRVSRRAQAPAMEIAAAQLELARQRSESQPPRPHRSEERSSTSRKRSQAAPRIPSPERAT